MCFYRLLNAPAREPELDPIDTSSMTDTHADGRRCRLCQDEVFSVKVGVLESKLRQ